MKKHLFVTGMPRSGTTLMDKVLSSHPDAAILSQPLPLLYVEAKRLFLNSLCSTMPPVWRAYPLNDMFGPNYYPPEIFLQFLRTTLFKPQFYRTVLNVMMTFSGQLTKPAGPTESLCPDNPLQLFEFIDCYLSEVSMNEESSVIGSKETYCEEYVPFFLDQGAKVILVLRDPRDVITSLNHGRGIEFTGASKPHLFNIRCWRKGVAMALTYQSHPNFIWIRYEDFVRNPRKSIGRITDFVQIAAFESGIFSKDLKGQNGQVWHSNSSHYQSPRIETHSVGRYSDYLTKSEELFIQACCLPEMSFLGYKTDLNLTEALALLPNHRENQTLEKEALRDYAWSHDRAREEQERLKRLTDNKFSPELFASKAAFEKLHSQLSSPENPNTIKHNSGLPND